MKLHFYKFQGAGNDFIIVDGRNLEFQLSEREINFLCHRRFGIGADGLMILGSDPEMDFTMRYYNSDGKEGSMCGNGGRCLVACAARLGISPRAGSFVFSAIDGIHQAEIIGDQGSEFQIRLGMNNVDTIDFYGKDGYFLNTGSPHLVLFDTDIARMDVSERGAFWRNHPDFAPQGTNVNFVEVASHGGLFVRTFERGVEDETLACGTGVTAAAIAAYVHAANRQMKPSEGSSTYAIRTPGGHLQVSFKSLGMQFYDVQLTGPAKFVFEGEIQL